jgi:predicted murein hydrolase (TIGR00659 family)
MTAWAGLMRLLLWSSATIALYLGARAVHHRWNRWWSTPLALTPLVLVAILVGAGACHHEYLRSTRWLVTLLGPATVAFAIPIYEQRALIRRHWPAIAVGVVVGSLTSMVSAWALAWLFGLDPSIKRSLLPRSVSVPFAVVVSDRIDGSPDLTAVFVVLTGVLGPMLGQSLIRHLPLRSALSRGAAFGMGAHGAGVAKAHQIGPEEGSVASLVMVLVGIVNVLAAPLVAWVL